MKKHEYAQAMGLCEEAVDQWDTNKDGNHICVDCEEEVDPDETFGNREWSDPRCEDCYETHRYRS